MWGFSRFSRGSEGFGAFRVSGLRVSRFRVYRS